MFDILNEVQYIKDILANGLSDKWITDAGVYVRYCKIEGYTKAETKEKLKEKVKKYVSGYNEFTYYKKINYIVDRYWKDDSAFREINSVRFSEEVLDWFYFNNGLTTKEKKILFTLFCWCDIQRQVRKDGFEYINLSGTMKKFKVESDLVTGGNIEKRELTRLSDCGYVLMTAVKGVYFCKFLNFPPFSEIEKSEHQLNISGDENLHSFGKYIDNYLKDRKETELNKLMFEAGKMRKSVCVDCKKEIFIKIKDTHTSRCRECYKIYRRNYKAQKQKEYREENEMWTNQN